MDFETAEKKIRELELKKDLYLYTAKNGSQIFVRKPEKVPKKLQRRRKVPSKLNIQIFLEPLGKRKFRPNHLRVLIDYHLKKKSAPKLYRKLLQL